MSFFVSVGTLLYYFISVRMIPAGYVYIGVTHYWTDYLFYVSQFIQGAHGRIVETNLYTENQAISIMAHWPNVLFGMLGHAIGLTPITSYHFAVFVLISCIGLATYILFRNNFPYRGLAFPAFIFFIFSTSLMNRLPNSSPVPYFPFELWNTPHLIFNRFAPIPHTLMQTLLSIVILYLLFSKNKRTCIIRIITGILFFLLMLIQPVVGLIILGSYWTTVVLWRADRDRLTTYILTAVGGAVAIWTKQAIFTQDLYRYVQLWEAGAQVRTNLPFLLASIGPIVPFALVGFITRIKKAEPIERFFMFLVIIGYSAFLSPLPEILGISNTRILTPIYIVGITWFAAVGANAIARGVSRITTCKKSVAMGILMILFLLSVAPTVVWEIRQKMQTPTSVTDLMIYLPADVSKAFQFLERTKPYDDVVLANPISFMDIRVPALSGHRTVNGTPYSLQEKIKRQEAMDIFQMRMTESGLHTWLTSHRVTYVLFTSYDGDAAKFRSAYPFLIPIFSTPSAIVYRIAD